MILQISVEFKEAYELLVSAWAAAFVKQQGSLDLSREWFNWCQAKLSPQNLVLIDEIRRMEQAVPIALLLSCPHAGAAEFVKWVGSLSGKEAYEIIYSFDPNTQRRPPESLRKMCQVLAKGLGMWHEQYFSRIANKVTGELAEIAAAGRVRAKDFEQRPQELVKELTQSLVWEADAVTEITMIPQGHLSPWPVYVIGGDHGVVFYPVSGSVLPREERGVLSRLRQCAAPGRWNGPPRAGAESCGRSQPDPAAAGNRKRCYPLHRTSSEKRPGQEYGAPPPCCPPPCRALMAACGRRCQCQVQHPLGGSAQLKRRSREGFAGKMTPQSYAFQL